MDHVDDYLMTQNLIPPQLCRSLIRESSLRKWSKHTWYDNTRGTRSSMAEKELDVIDSTPIQFKSLFKYLSIALQNYQKKYSILRGKENASWISRISHVRFNRYKVGTKMRAHRDHIHSLFDGKLKGIPILSFVGLLNDKYEGGEFMCREKEIKLRRGDILLFPSNFMYPHGVEEITKGRRHSFVSWPF